VKFGPNVLSRLQKLARLYVLDTVIDRIVASECKTFSWDGLMIQLSLHVNACYHYQPLQCAAYSYVGLLVYVTVLVAFDLLQCYTRLQV